MITLAEFRRHFRSEESNLIREALQKNDWLMTRAAEQLGVGEGSLRALVKQHGLTKFYDKKKRGRGRPKKKP